MIWWWRWGGGGELWQQFVNEVDSGGVSEVRQARVGALSSMLDVEKPKDYVFSYLALLLNVENTKDRFFQPNSASFLSAWSGKDKLWCFVQLSLFPTWKRQKIIVSPTQIKFSVHKCLRNKLLIFLDRLEWPNMYLFVNVHWILHKYSKNTRRGQVIHISFCQISVTLWQMRSKLDSIRVIVAQSAENPCRLDWNHSCNAME